MGTLSFVLLERRVENFPIFSISYLDSDIDASVCPHLGHERGPAQCYREDGE
jgi:hypothetical protein